MNGSSCNNFVIANLYFDNFSAKSVSNRLLIEGFGGVFVLYFGPFMF